MAKARPVDRFDKGDRAAPTGRRELSLGAPATVLVLAYDQGVGVPRGAQRAELAEKGGAGQLVQSVAF
jgi:hypothetical protein